MKHYTSVSGHTLQNVQDQHNRRTTLYIMYMSAVLTTGHLEDLGE